jgi:hypothetical protein
VAKPWFWNLLLLLAITLAGVKIMSAVTRPQPPLPPPPEVPAEAVSSPAPSASPPSGSYLEIVNRNLFSAGRGKVETQPGTKAPAAVPKAVAPPKATLFGIVMDDGGEKYAFLTDDAKGQKGKAKRYREGDPFAGGTVEEIRPDRVVLVVGVTKHTVILRTPKAGLESYRPPTATTPPAASRPTPGRRAPRTETNVRTRRQRVERPRQTSRSSIRRSRLERPAESWDREEEEFFPDEDFPVDEDGFPVTDEEYGEFDEESEW